MRVVDSHERSETVRADIASDDQEIARRNIGQKPVLIAERNDSHVNASVASSGHRGHRSWYLSLGVVMPWHASMMLTAVARPTEADLPTVDAEPGRRYPVFIVLVRY
jgi:hypothetical protein